MRISLPQIQSAHFLRVDFIFFSLFFLFGHSILLGNPKKTVKESSLRFDLSPDDVLIVEKHQDISLASSQGVETREEKNRIVLKAGKKKSDLTDLSGDFLTYSRNPAGSGVYRQDRTYHSKFQINVNGAYVVRSNEYMPNLRSLPTFPDVLPATGKGWESPGEEVMELDGYRILIPIKVNYTYTGIKRLEKEGIPPGNYYRIEYSYHYDIYQKNREIPIVRIRGESKSILYFDNKQGIPVYDRSRIRYKFTTSSGEDLKYNYDIESIYKKIRKIKDEDRIRTAKAITDDLEKNKDVSVRSDKEGIVLEMEDILFDYNSSEISSRAQKAIKAIAEVLNKHSDREIRISGHTDSKGSSSYNQDLSEKRAKAVLEILKNNYNIDPGRMSYRGFGETKPIAPNTTKDGQSKNRRVEILIVME